MWNGHITAFWPRNTNLILASLVAAVISIAANRINCSDFVRELPQTIPKVALLKEPQVINRIFIVDNEEIDIYVPQSTKKLRGCSDHIIPVGPSWPNRKPGLIVDSKCPSKTKHGPLSARTKTMDDVRKDEVSIRKELTEVHLKRYERERIRNRIDN